MKRLLLGAAAIIAFAAPAVAADLPARTYTKAPVYTPPQAIYNWTGFYIGGNVGGAFAGGNSLEGSGGRFMGGIQGGADYQFSNNWVIGAEAQYDWMTNNNNGGVTFPAGTLVISQSRSARLGYRPVRLRLGSDAAVRQGRLRLARQQQHQRQQCGRGAAL